MKAGLAVAALALLALAACGRREAPAPEPAPQDRAGAEAPEEPEPPFDPIGTWTVVGHYMPGISAMTDEEAKAHDGQTVQLGASEALSNGERCAPPRYPARNVVTEDYLATEFNLPPEALKPVEKRAAGFFEISGSSVGDGPWSRLCAAGDQVIADAGLRLVHRHYMGAGLRDQAATLASAAV